MPERNEKEKGWNVFHVASGEKTIKVLGEVRQIHPAKINAEVTFYETDENGKIKTENGKPIMRTVKNLITCIDIFVK